MNLSLVATLPGSAHRELKERHRRIALLATSLAALGHLVVLLALPAPAPLPYSLRAPERKTPRLEDISYTVIPDAPTVPRPILDLEPDFDAFVLPARLQPDFVPQPPPEWAPAVTAAASGTPPGPASFLTSPEVAPEVIHRVAPVYPELARLAEAEGRVVLTVLVGDDGRVRDVQVVSSDAAPTLERAAIEAVRAWLFAPARQGGRPVAVRIEIPIEFRLH